MTGPPSMPRRSSGGSCRCRRRASDGWRFGSVRPSSSDCWKATDATDPEAAAARERFAAELAGVGRAASMEADEARAAGLDPLTFRVRRRWTAASARTCSQVASLPPTFSYSAFDTYDRCGLQYAFQYVYRIPRPERRAGVRFGTDGARRVRGIHQGAPRAGWPVATRRRPARTSSALFRRDGRPSEFGDRPTEERYQRRVAHPARQLLGGRGRDARGGARRGARLRAHAWSRRTAARPSSSTARSTGSTGCPRAASRSSTTRPAGVEPRRTSTRASSCRSTRWPAATRSASARPSG